MKKDGDFVALPGIKRDIDFILAILEKLAKGTAPSK